LPYGCPTPLRMIGPVKMKFYGLRWDGGADEAFSIADCGLRIADLLSRRREGRDGPQRFTYRRRCRVNAAFRGEWLASPSGVARTSAFAEAAADRSTRRDGRPAGRPYHRDGAQGTARSGDPRALRPLCGSLRCYGLFGLFRAKKWQGGGRVADCGLPISDLLSRRREGRDGPQRFTYRRRCRVNAAFRDRVPAGPGSASMSGVPSRGLSGEEPASEGLRTSQMSGERSPSPRPNGFPSPPQVSFPRGDVRFANRGPVPGRGRSFGRSGLAGILFYEVHFDTFSIGRTFRTAGIPFNPGCPRLLPRISRERHRGEGGAELPIGDFGLRISKGGIQDRSRFIKVLQDASRCFQVFSDICRSGAFLAAISEGNGFYGGEGGRAVSAEDPSLQDPRFKNCAATGCGDFGEFSRALRIFRAEERAAWHLWRSIQSYLPNEWEHPACL